MDAKRLAVHVLSAHDALRAASDSEPEHDQEGMPLDAAEWIRWREQIYAPAYGIWDTAMNDLNRALGHEFSRHPFNFRPICESIIAGEEVAAMREP